MIFLLFETLYKIPLFQELARKLFFFYIISPLILLAYKIDLFHANNLNSPHPKKSLFVFSPDLKILL